jgi:hypothetical protein
MVLSLWPLRLCIAFTKLLLRKVFFFRKIRSAQRRIRRSEHWRSWPHPAIRQDVKSSPGHTSELGKERWGSSRRKPSTITSRDHPPGHAGSSYIGRRRDGQPTFPPSSKLLSILFSLSSLRIILCVRGARFGSGSSRSHRRLGNDREGSFGRKFEGSKRKIDQKSLKEESEHFRNGPPYKPGSECAPRQRIRKNLPPRGRKPKVLRQWTTVLSLRRTSRRKW